MRHAITLATLTSVALLPLAASAQETSNDKVIAELIVTATKREQTLQDVPFSVGLQTEEQIRNSGTNNIIDLARNVAGLTIADLGPGQSQVAIRGISSGQVVRDQPGVKESVGVYLDESPISIALFTPDLDLFDLERMEILRGPQGTLFGAGSSSGTLRYITAQPKLGIFQGAAEVTGTDGSGADTGGSVKGMLNAPIGDKTALRIAAYYDWIPGFIDAVQPDLSVKKNVDSGTKYGARVAMLFQPSDALSITPRIVYQKLETDGYPRADFYNILGNQYTTTEPAVRLGEREQFTQIGEGLTDEFTLGDLKIAYDFGPVTLTSISSYTDRSVEVDRDASQLTGSVTFDIGGTAAQVRLNSPLIDKTDLQSYSQELRLSSNGNNSAIDWLVGAFYQHTDRDYGQTLPTPGYDAVTSGLGFGVSADFGAPPDTPFFSRLSYKFEQWALFGEGTYHFNEQWALTGGLRYYNFDEDRVLTFAGFFAVPTLDEPGSTTSDGFSPRVILTYQPNDDVTLSAQAARGFRLGGINDPLNAPLCSASDLATFGGHPTWDDETVWDYEIGAKMRLAGGTVTFNTAVFYSDIKDLQDGIDVGTCSSRIVLNVPKAHSYGIEAELFARPNVNWDFGVSATWLNAELDSTITTDVAGVPTVVAGIEKGNRLPTSPEFQGAASVTYRWDWSTNLFSFVNATYQYVGSSFSRIADEAPNFGLISSDAAAQAAGAARLIPFGAPATPLNIPFDAELPSYDLLNLRFVLGAERWNAALFCNNVFDERALLSVDRERGRSARVGYLTNQPRTYGVSLLFNF
ncbi:MAG TPA: TonB-dependent receptor [Vicinamibacterales bacterium]|jgi:iron complex outermembrane receptor protein